MKVVALSMAVFLSLAVLTARSQGICGTGTYLSNDTNQCLCNPDNNSNDDPNVIKLAGIFDTTTYVWGPEVFDLTVQLLNQGEWGVLPEGMRVEYQLEDAKCDGTTAAQAYWKVRPVDGIIGARCSGASVTLAQISGLEEVPHLSPASNSARFSENEGEEFPFFSRLVAPNNEHGEGKCYKFLFRQPFSSSANISHQLLFFA